MPKGSKKITKSTLKTTITTATKRKREELDFESLVFQIFAWFHNPNVFTPSSISFSSHFFPRILYFQSTLCTFAWNAMHIKKNLTYAHWKMIVLLDLVYFCFGFFSSSSSLLHHSIKIYTHFVSALFFSRSLISVYAMTMMVQAHVKNTIDCKSHRVCARVRVCVCVCARRK